MTTNDSYHLTAAGCAGCCKPIFDPERRQWTACVSGWNARADTRHGAALLAFMAWLDALPPEMRDSPDVWFNDSKEIK